METFHDLRPPTHTKNHMCVPRVVDHGRWTMGHESAPCWGMVHDPMPMAHGPWALGQCTWPCPRGHRTTQKQEPNKRVKPYPPAHKVSWDLHQQLHTNMHQFQTSTLQSSMEPQSTIKELRICQQCYPWARCPEMSKPEIHCVQRNPICSGCLKAMCRCSITFRKPCAQNFDCSMNIWKNSCVALCTDARMRQWTWQCTDEALLLRDGTLGVKLIPWPHGAMQRCCPCCHATSCRERACKPGEG